MIRPVLRKLSFICLLALLACYCPAEIRIVLKNSFIEQFQNRVLISGDYFIDKAHAHPNPAASDGDMHIAGRADAFGLATVAEIMNAAEETPAVDFVHANEASGNTVPVIGAWRLWCEHGGDVEHIQGDQLDPFTTTNPNHVFEVHPITSIGGIDVTSGIHPINGFTEKDADEAFQKYESTACQIIPHGSTTEIRTTMAGYNYVKFVIQPDLSRKKQADGGGWLCPADVFNLEGDLIVHDRWMAFVPNTPAETQFIGLHQGDQMTVLGIPRISLARVWWRVHHTANGALSWSLPYEMIIVGNY